MKDAKYILRLTLILFLITAVVAGLLGLVNYLTEDRIDELTRQKAEAAMQEVFPAGNYEEIPAGEDGITAAYRADDAGYVVRVSVNGFGGAIDMMVGVDNDGKVLGISVISHTETAGLGATAAASTSAGEAFRGQFAGMSGTVTVTKDGGSIDALTGATVTSRAVVSGVNLALDFVKEVG